jgi:hypothetical protein
MIRFLQLQYRLKKIDESYLDQLVLHGTITEAQKAEIIA